METKSELAKAVLAVMQEVKGIEKNTNVGSGTNTYKGVADQDVKKIIGEAMQKHGLCLLPIGVRPRTEVNILTETYNNNTKQKQSVFTEATTQYLLLHKSGESQVLTGYGHGVDSQDKGAGKATTYALKYTLLYTFLVPTGKIDDADNTHSEQVDGRRANGSTSPALQPNTNFTGEKKELVPGMPAWKKAVDHIAAGLPWEKIENSYFISNGNKIAIESEAKAVKKVA